jgi:hypothetical protein
MCDGKVGCPIDRSMTQTESENCLPKNWSVVAAVADVGKKGKEEEREREKESEWVFLCGVCHDADAHAAVSWCGECTRFMCANAERMHDRFQFNSPHPIATPILKIHDLRLLCHVHKQPIACFDVECEHGVCRECLRDEHLGHRCQDLSDASAQWRERMEGYIARAGKLKTHLVEESSRVALSRMEMETSHQKSNEAIEDVFRQVSLTLSPPSLLFPFVLFLLFISFDIVLISQMSSFKPLWLRDKMNSAVTSASVTQRVCVHWILCTIASTSFLRV